MKTPEQYADEYLLHRTTYTTEEELLAKQRARLTRGFTECQRARESEQIAHLRDEANQAVQRSDDLMKENADLDAALARLRASVFEFLRAQREFRSARRVYSAAMAATPKDHSKCRELKDARDLAQAQLTVTRAALEGGR